MFSRLHIAALEYSCMVLFANYVCIKIKEGKKMKQSYDAIILGAGLYGLYSALQLIQILDKKRGGGG